MAEEIRFYRLWTKAVGTPDYDKSEWQALEKLIYAARAVVEDDGSTGIDGLWSKIYRLRDLVKLVQ